MTEKLLNLAQVSPHVEQMRRVAVAQAMRMDPVRNADAARPGRQNAPDVAHP